MLRFLGNSTMCTRLGNSTTFSRLGNDIDFLGNGQIRRCLSFFRQFYTLTNAVYPYTTHIHLPVLIQTQSTPALGVGGGWRCERATTTSKNSGYLCELAQPAASLPPACKQDYGRYHCLQTVSRLILRKIERSFSID